MTGKWITTAEFAELKPINVFHRQLANHESDPEAQKHLNRHILFRKKFTIDKQPEKAIINISADDYYKLYINGKFVTQGPTASYPINYGYNTVDVTEFLHEGENILAVHTLYQGLINRVWVSGDLRHGLICDLEIDGKLLLSSDESFLTHLHTAYSEIGTVGYDTQFLEDYDSSSPEIGFYEHDFDDSSWKPAKLRKFADYKLVPQKTKRLIFENISPAEVNQNDNRLFIDFGSCYVGYLNIKAIGKKGDKITIRCAQELNEESSVRFGLRANCRYEEHWILSGNVDTLDWFDYKAFRYAELIVPDDCIISEISLSARHYPFNLNVNIKHEYKNDPRLQAIWQLCVHTQKYGVQEVIQDCMEREKGFYLGDGCYTALTNMILTGDDSIMRKLIDEAFLSSFISDTLVTCMDCSFMQEIAEYPLILIYTILWHYRLTEDKEYLQQNYKKAKALLNAYRTRYEENGLLCNVDKWCVVEWPDNFRDGYDVDLSEGKMCKEPHISLNSYYIEAIESLNKIALILDEPPYRDTKPLYKAFTDAFYDNERHLFKDSSVSQHTSYIGNIFAFAFDLCPNKKCEENILNIIKTRGISQLSFFTGFLLLMSLVRRNENTLLRQLLSEDGAWMRIINEGGTTTFEGWGKDTKWNTSLFHLTLSYAAVFLADIDTKKLFTLGEI